MRAVCVCATYLLMYSPVRTLAQALHLKQPRCHCRSNASRAWPFLMSRPQPAQSEEADAHAPNTHTHMNACTHTHKLTQTHPGRQAHTQTHTRTQAHALRHAHTLTHAYAHTHAHMHTNARTQMHTHTHTHKVE